MKKLLLLFVLMTTLGYSQTIKTEISIHNYPYASGELTNHVNTFSFKCSRAKDVTITKTVILSQSATDQLYAALTIKNPTKGLTVYIYTLDNKLISIKYVRYMFKNYAVFDIIDRNDDTICHIYCLPKIQWDKLFNRNNTSI